ncbi:MAG: glutamine synthetase beta-grasp domain-containing protein [Chloroflexi bacterium]|nr:glutamine synthetase beta-grasp domain-containing protein [Chloroflexota bacterium]
MINIEARQEIEGPVLVTANRDQGRKYVLHVARDRQVRLIHLWFVDAAGCLKSLAIPAERLDAALREGVTVCVASVVGPGARSTGSVVALPDPDSFRVLPWGVTTECAVARMFCDILTPDGCPFEGDSKYILRRNLGRAARAGYTYYVSTDVEFILRSATPRCIGALSSLDDVLLKSSRNFRREMMTALDALGISARYQVHHGPETRHEIHLSYADAVSVADSVTTCRLVVKQIASRNHFDAVFASGPSPESKCLGTYLHQSLFSGGENAFHDADDEMHLSLAARSYAGSLLRRAPEITPFTGPWVSWRDWPDPASGRSLCLPWPGAGEDCQVGVFGYQPSKERATRIALRLADTGHNPYVCFSAMLAAGLDGVKRASANLREAAVAMETGNPVRQALGELLSSAFALGTCRVGKAQRGGGNQGGCANPPYTA